MSGAKQNNMNDSKPLGADEEYYIGLDCGTASVGWAVTNSQYEIAQFRGKSAWGVRLFQEGQTAANRRVNRSVRLRYKRRAKRLAWLAKLFEDEIQQVDPNFYDTIRESKFWYEDKRDQYGNSLSKKHTLFNDDTYTDKDFYDQFPTIFHLRSALIAGSAENVDIRHYFLAIHHILKTRGHFLYEGREFSADGAYEELFDGLTEICKEVDVNVKED